MCGFAVTVWLMIGYLALDVQNERLPGRLDTCYNVTYTNITGVYYNHHTTDGYYYIPTGTPYSVKQYGNTTTNVQTEL